MLPNENPDRHQHADQSTVEGHPAVPDGDKVDRVGKIERGIVLADDVVDDEEGSPADEHADQRVEEKVLNLLLCEPQAAQPGGTAHPQIDAEERHQIGDAVPVDAESRTEMNRDP